ncbi:Ig-like domain-containing protein, partial [Variovorax humicola]
KLYVDGKEVPATYEPKTGTLTPDTPLTEGPHDITYTVTDLAGNESLPSGPIVITVDNTAPATPAAPGSYEDNVGKVQNPTSTAPTTDDSTPGVNIGKIPADTTPKLYVDAKEVPATYDPNTGTLTPNTPLDEGRHWITYTLTDSAGNQSAPSGPLVLTIDYTAPAAPAAPGSYEDNVGKVQNPTSTAPTTDDSTPGINIGTIPADTTPKLYVDAKEVPATYDPKTGTLTPNTPLGEGRHEITYTLTDLAGNESAPSGPLVLTVDTMAPEALSAPTLTDDVGAIVGLIADNAITDDGKPTYAGTAPAGVATVKVYDNGMYLGTSSVQPDGKWSFEPALPLASGPHSLQVSAVDAAGNEGPLSVAKPFTVAGDAPAAPAITLVNDNVGALQGSLQPNASTDDTTPTISGTGTPGTTIKLYANGQEVGTTTVAGDGTWSVTPTLSGDGLKNLTATATDGAGQSSPSTGAYPIVLDTSAPATPAAPTATDDLAPTIGVIVPGGTTNDATPVISGTGTAGDTIKVYDNGNLIGTTVVQPDGSWSLTPKDPLIDGAHSLTTTETDPAGNTSAAGPALPFTVDTSAVIVSITHAVDNVGAIQANVADNGATDDTTPELIGTATAGATVTIREGATVIGTTTAGPTGAWSLLLPAQGEGAHVYTASATNAAGTTGTVDFHLSIDTTASAVPAVTGVSDDVGSIQGPVANAGFTDDTTPALSGTGPASTTINVYDDAKLIGTTVSDASGNWSYTPVSPLAQGLHSVTAASVDAVGNVSAQSPARTFTVDTAAPDALAAPTLTDDVGAIVGLIADNAITDDGKPTYAGTAPAGV